MDSLSLTRWPGSLRIDPLSSSSQPSRPSGEAHSSHLLTQGFKRDPTDQVEMFTMRGFLPPCDCAALIERIEARRRPSTVLYGNGDDRYRTSETCELDMADPVVAALDARLEQVSGIPACFGEALQGQRYATGQEFKAHTDTFDPESPETEAHCAVAGQRTWTFLLYLNSVAAGGLTRFDAIDRLVIPEAGRLVCWNNRLSDGRPNPATVHHAMKVRRGTKYVVTRWYRERPWR